MLSRPSELYRSMFSRVRPCLVPTLSVVAAVELATGSASAADTVIGANIGWIKPLNASGIDAGWGFDARLGRRLNGEIIVFTGELDGGYASFGGDLAPSVYRGTAGVRLGIGAILRPVVFAHAGVAQASFSNPPDANLDRTAFTYDAGGGLDFTLLPLINVGIFGAYNSVAGKSGADALTWATLGANAELVF